MLDFSYLAFELLSLRESQTFVIVDLVFERSDFSLQLFNQLNLLGRLTFVALWQAGLEENKIDQIFVLAQEFDIIFFFLCLSTLEESIEVFEV